MIISKQQFCFSAEVCRVFAPYTGRTSGSHCTTAKRRASYTRSYICLDGIDQIMVPGKVEKEKLYAAGLGEKKLTFFGILLLKDIILIVSVIT